MDANGKGDDGDVRRSWDNGELAKYKRDQVGAKSDPCCLGRYSIGCSSANDGEDENSGDDGNPPENPGDELKELREGADEERTNSEPIFPSGLEGTEVEF